LNSPSSFASQRRSASDALPTIINLSWDQAEAGFEGDSGQFFSPTKAAIAAFSKSLAKSVGPKVRVNCIAPGWIQTAWGTTASEAWERRAQGESILARWGQPSDIANAAFMLASRECEFINGQTIAVNGGWKPLNAT
jgi:3-oxoacyl-[acyl-carrier protein] reductase